MRTILTVSLMMAGLGGCVVPKFPDQPKNTLVYEKGAFGGKLAIANGADTAVEVDDAKVNPITKEFEVKKLVFDSRQSVNQAMLVQQMAKMTDWLMTNVELNKVYGANATAILHEVMPTISQFLTGYNQTALVKASMPRANMITELTALMQQINKFDPTIVTQAIDAVKGGVFTAPQSASNPVVVTPIP